MKIYTRLNSLFFPLIAFFFPVFLFLFPGYIYPATRLFVLFIFISIGFILWSIRNFLNKGVIFLRGGYLLPFFLFVVLIVVSILLLPTSGGMNDAFFGTGGMMLFSAIMFFVMIHIGDKRSIQNSVYGIAISALFLALISVFSFLSLANKIIPASFFSEKAFIAGENMYYLFAFFVVTFFVGISRLLTKKEKAVGLLVILFSILGAGVLVINFIKNGSGVTFLPFSSGWAMTIEIFKNIKNLIIGIGFNQFGLYSPLLKTAELNSDKYVFLRFPQTSNAIFELLNSIGLFGFAVFGLVCFRIYHPLRKYFNKKLWKELNFGDLPSEVLYILPFSAILLVYFFLPLNPILIFLLFFFLTILVLGLKEGKIEGYEEERLQLVTPPEGFLSFQTGGIFEKTLVAQKIFAVFFGLLLVCVFYFLLAYPVLAEFHFVKYLQAVYENKGRTAYEEMNAAASANRKNDYFFRELSGINFQLALSLNEKKGLRTEDRQSIAVLVNQSLTAARGATEINNQKIANWETLASLYQALIPTDATQSASLAVQSYVQAVNLNPQDPVLRVKFAQMLYAAGLYRDAISQLNAALSIKSDFANAYYNLALNYKQLAELDNAKKALEIALKFVEKDSNDDKILRREIEQLEIPDLISQEASINETKTESKLTEPDTTIKLDKLKKDALQLVPASPSATPSTSR